jgi:hypothetical protein
MGLLQTASGSPKLDFPYTENLAPKLIGIDFPVLLPQKITA